MHRGSTTIAVAARRMIRCGVNHLPVLAADGGKLVGIVTSWDIAKAVASNFLWLDEIMSRDVVTTTENEPVEDAAQKMEAHSISALPVVDGELPVIGLITSDAISTLVGGRTREDPFDPCRQHAVPCHEEDKDG